VGDGVVSRNPFYSGRFFHSLTNFTFVVNLFAESQSLLFRSVFPFMIAVRGASGSVSAVAIPSIQVGFSILKQTRMDIMFSRFPSQSLLFRSVFPFAAERAAAEILVELSQSLLFRSVFPFVNEDGATDDRCEVSQSLLFRSVFPFRWPSSSGLASGTKSQSLLFRSVFPLSDCSRHRGRRDLGRNPFYSGRFFHSLKRGYASGIGIRSQSLLFRSVFPFAEQCTYLCHGR